MIEIIVIWRMAVNIGKIAVEKGLKKFPYQLMAVLLWIFGEFSGVLIANIIFGNKGNRLLGYAFALAGAVLGAGVAFLVMRYIPDPPEIYPTSGLQVKWRERRTTQFRRSGWVPGCVSLLAFGCVLISFGIGVANQVRSNLVQIQVSHPLVGTQIDDGNHILRPTAQIDSKAEVIYLGFTLTNPARAVVTVTIDIQVNGERMYSYSEKYTRGDIMTKLERSSLDIVEFPKGAYTVNISAGSYSQATTSFIVQ